MDDVSSPPPSSPSSPVTLSRLPPPPPASAPTSAVASPSASAQPDPSPRPTVRIRINITGDKPGTVVSYAELYKQAVAKTEGAERPVSSLGNNSVAEEDGSDDQEGDEVPYKAGEDSFFDRILANAANYDEPDTLPKPGKRRRADHDDYDVADPFIDDSEMLVDDDYDMRMPKHDGFFAYRGPLERLGGAEDAHSSDAFESSSSRTKKPTTKRKTNGVAAKETLKGRKAAAVTDATDDSGSESGDDQESAKKKAKTSPKQKSLLSQVSYATTASKARKVADKAKEKDKVKKSAEAATSKPADKKSVVVTPKAKSGISSGNEAKTKKATKVTNGTGLHSEKKKKDGDVAVTPGTPSGGGRPDPGPNAIASLSSSAAAMSIHEGHGLDTKPTTSKRILEPLPTAVLEILNELRAAAAEESFEVKSKFPPVLRPIVMDAARMMLKFTSLIEDQFIQYLMDILPYNRFTLRKFVAKNVYWAVIEEREAEFARLHDVFRKLVADAMVPQLEQYNLTMSSLDSSSLSAPMAASGDDISPGSELGGETRREVDGSKARRFKWTDSLKKALFDILTLEKSIVGLKNEFSELVGTTEKVADLTVRKQSYQKLQSCWPEGWMTSTDLSRHFTTYRTKVDPSLTNKRRNVSAPTSPVQGPAKSYGQHNLASVEHLSVSLPPLASSTYRKLPSTKAKRIKTDDDDHHHSDPPKRVKKADKPGVPKPRGLSRPRKPKEPVSDLSDHNGSGPRPSPHVQPVAEIVLKSPVASPNTPAELNMTPSPLSSATYSEEKATVPTKSGRNRPWEDDVAESPAEGYGTFSGARHDGTSQEED